MKEWAPHVGSPFSLFVRPNFKPFAGPFDNGLRVSAKFYGWKRRKRPRGGLWVTYS